MNNIKSCYIRKRNNKHYVYIEYIDETGKKKQKNCGSFENKKEADKLLVKIKNDINNNKYSIPSSITFVDRCYKYYNDKENYHSPNTTKTAKYMIKNHIAPYFKDIKLTDITTSMFQSFINDLYNKDRKLKTITLARNISIAVINEAYRLKEINEKISDFIVYPKKDKDVTTDIYNLNEVKYLLEQIKGNLTLEIPINLFCYCGMRIGEITALTFDDIDYENNIIDINKILINDNKEFLFKKPKTTGSVRSIAAPAHVIELIKTERKRQNLLKLQGKLVNKKNIICLNSRNGYWRASVFAKTYRQFISTINMRYVRPHALRHIHATLLLLGGTDMKTVSGRLGHSDVKITMNTYSHVLNEMDRKAVENIEKILL
ncbi:Tyrosine recombinase XerC [Terrisporobacter petrolearius]|uniref:site-specific integrase n=1 Tax=Terrisporobacter petrolearius TaxID=1460447 RepID=UPI003368C0AE